MERMTGLLATPRWARFEEVNAGGVPSAWVWPPEVTSGCAVLYLHGGGYIAGSIRTHRPLAARISRAARAPVLLVDYRLAPEYPFPAAVCDATSAYRWLLGRQFSPSKLAVAGDSAGGGLAIASMIALRDDGVELPAAGVCLSPWLDLAMTGASVATNEGKDPVLRRADLEFMAARYLGAADPRTPTASPLYARLAGLPPLLFQVGTDEILLDDARRCAERARREGVSVELEVWEGMIHVWQFAVGLIPEAARAVRRVGGFVRARWQV